MLFIYNQYIPIMEVTKDKSDKLTSIEAAKKKLSLYTDVIKMEGKEKPPWELISKEKLKTIITEKQLEKFLS
jgi:hypothetical protein